MGGGLQGTVPDRRGGAGILRLEAVPGTAGRETSHPGELAAAILRPYVRQAVTWIVEQHGLFQTCYCINHLGGDRHQASFDPDDPRYFAADR